MEKYCQNCGSNCHCNENCEKDYGEKEKTIVCTHCRHSEEDDSWKDQVFYDSKNNLAMIDLE